MRRACITAGVVPLLVLSAACGAGTLEKGSDWIANATAKVRLESVNLPDNKQYNLIYFRRSATTNGWELALEGHTPVDVPEVGSWLLCANLVPSDVRTSVQADRATLAYRIKDAVGTPPTAVFAEFTITLYANSPCMRLQLTGRSHHQMSMVTYAFAHSPVRTELNAARYHLYDVPTGSNGYSIAIVDAAKLPSPTADREHVYSRFTALYYPGCKRFCAVFGLPGDTAPKRAWVSHSSHGPGFGALNLRSLRDCAILGECVEGLSAIDDIAHWVEDGYYRFQRAATGPSAAH